MKEYYDYCDAYDAYGCKYNNAVTSLDQSKSNTIKTFSCNVCKQSKLILKKSVNDSVFKCEDCIEKNGSNNDEQQQHSQQNQERTWSKWFSFF